MRRWVTAVVLTLTLAAVGAVLLTLLHRQRANRDLVYSVNNLRELGQFAELYLADMPGRPPADGPEAPGKARFAPVPVERLRELGLAPAVPAGTVPNPALPPDRRLSWVATLLPTFNQARQPTAEWSGRLDRAAAWDAGPNRAVAETPLDVVTVYTNSLTYPAGEPAVTQFVGVGGVGADAPAGPPSARSGAFRYDAPTPFAAITDGLSETALFADVSTGLGPWLSGGPATVRPLDPAARPVIGPGGQFGGNAPAGALFGFADHSVRVLSPRTDPAVVANLATVAGGGAGDPLPGE